MRGSVPLVFFSAAVYLIVTLGTGLWISTFTNTQQQTMFVAFFILMIYLLMSGLFTPVESMPRWAQLLAEAEILEEVAGVRLDAHEIASAIAANLCLEKSLPQACADATDFVHGALVHAYKPGKGKVVVLNHLWQMHN